MKARLKAKGKKVVWRAGVVVGLSTVFLLSASLVLVGSTVSGLAERFGRSPMKPPE